MPSSAAVPAASATLFGQPRGLATLFMTEMWERFTYYGMRAILIFFLTAAVSSGGMGLDARAAPALYGLYVAGTYLFSLLGGWMADRLIGAQRAVAGGALFIIAGNALLALGNTPVFYCGLLVIVVGIGLLKPNASALVATLYPEGGSRRDAGFSFFYMGINVGGTLGPLAVAPVQQHFGWGWGFLLPALGMAFGLGQFLATRRYLGGAGLAPERRGSWWPVIALAALLGLLSALAYARVLPLDPVRLSGVANWAMLALGVGYFLYLLLFAGLSPLERRRVLVMIALVAASVLFWAGYEQTGTSLNLFADRYTELTLFGVHIAAGTLQAVNPFFIIVFAPLFAGLWLALGRRGLDLPATGKFALGLIFLGLGFLVMYFACQPVLHGQKVLPTWLLATYLLHTAAELCLSPVGLSYMSKLAPPRFVGQVMGIWFLSLALGNNFAGQLAGEYDPSHLETLPGLFLR
ncbi:MAG: peptide MFS transporter, partial [Gammaproteobacteria bacterium]|nr:peptide MFS transporter [Gammaproteobacteria bacterium]